MKDPKDLNQNDMSRVNSSMNVSRRHFISSVGITAAGIMAGACSKKDNPAEPEKKKTYPEGSSKVATANVTSYNLTVLKSSLETMFTEIGGVDDIIKTGDTVGIKINLTGGNGSARSYETQSGLPVGETYWTNPELLRALGQLLKDMGVGKIYVLEAIYDWESINNYGYKQVIDSLGATFIDLNQTAPYSDYVQRPVGNQRLIYSSLTQNGVLNDLDCFISLPKAKLHKGAGVTHGMKNLVGTLPVPCGKYNAGGSNRSGIHQHRTQYDGNPDSNLCRVIIDLNHATPINLVVNDAVKTVLGSEGPWNRDEWALVPKNFNRLIVGKDPVATDAISTKIIGYDPMAEDKTWPFPTSINYLKLADELGMGNYDLEMIEVVGAGI
ncbi:DUF362 domain-containing protein [candidate division KSB1 bacterium]|nr:DUF362 domain-containing protein [candidate division KSB1 bacterium]